VKVFELTQRPGTEAEGLQAENALARELAKHGIERDRLLSTIMTSTGGSAPDLLSQCSEDVVAIPHTDRPKWAWDLGSAVRALFPSVNFFATMGCSLTRKRATFTFYGETSQSRSAAELFADLWVRTSAGAADYVRGVKASRARAVVPLAVLGAKEEADAPVSPVSSRTTKFSFLRAVGEEFKTRCRRIAAQRKQLYTAAIEDDPAKHQLVLVDPTLRDVAKKAVEEVHGKLRSRRCGPPPKCLDKAAYDAGRHFAAELPTDSGRLDG
jgi:hypothetical protein